MNEERPWNDRGFLESYGFAYWVELQSWGKRSDGFIREGARAFAYMRAWSIFLREYAVSGHAPDAPCFEKGIGELGLTAEEQDRIRKTARVTRASSSISEDLLDAFESFLRGEVMIRSSDYSSDIAKEISLERVEFNLAGGLNSKGLIASDDEVKTDIGMRKERLKRAVNRISSGLFKKVLARYAILNNGGGGAEMALQLEAYIQALYEYAVLHGAAGVTSLSLYRRHSYPALNAQCVHCGKLLSRKTDQSRCKRHESHACYAKRDRGGMAHKKTTEALFRDQGVCANCHQATGSVTHIHRVMGTERRFCSESCYRGFRRRSAKGAIVS